LRAKINLAGREGKVLCLPGIRRTLMAKSEKFEDMGLAKTTKPPADPDIKNGNSNSLKAAMKALEKMK